MNTSHALERIFNYQGRPFRTLQADEGDDAWFVSAENECEELRQDNAVLLPKAEAYERLAGTADTFSLGETAKLLGIPAHGRNKLIEFLRDEGILMTNNVARQRFIDRDYFQIVQQEYVSPDGTSHARPVTRVYTSGIEFIRQRMQNFILRKVAKIGSSLN